MNREAVIYLDFDGVLHHDAVYQSRGRGIHIDQTQAPGRTLFEWAPVLVEALAPHPEVRLVLSTSWVRVLGFSRARNRLPEPLRQRVIGATYHSRHHFHPDEKYTGPLTLRGQEVERDVARRRPTWWLAIDDNSEGWTAAGRANLLLCQSHLGLSEPAVQGELMRRLAGVTDAPRAHTSL